MKNQKLRVDNLKHGYLFLIVLIFFTIEFIAGDKKQKTSGQENLRGTRQAQL